MSMIETESLVKIFHSGIRAVDDVSFNVEEREIFGLLGPNGAGKTSTIMILITLSKPTSGRARVCGYDVLEDAVKVRGCIGYVSQDVAVDEYLTGRENLRLQGCFYHIPKLVLEKRIDEVLGMVDLTDRAGDLVSTYSGGMRKRLDIAEGLIHRPKVLFLDEPTLGLDIQTRRRIWEYVKLLRDEFGITIFLTTHYMEEADLLCDRVAIMDYGKLKIIDDPSRLKSQIGRHIVTLRLGGMDAGLSQTIVDEIARLPYSERILSSGEGVCRIVARNGDAAVPRISELVSRMGGFIESISVEKPSLDDVFLSYTGRALRDEAVSREAFLSDRVRMMRMRGSRF